MDVEQAMKEVQSAETLPLESVAGRVWAGTKYEYPTAARLLKAATTLAAEVRRLRGERVALEDVFGAACVVDNANARRASAQVQDRCERTDYEASLGFALDTLRGKIDGLRRVRREAAEAARRKA